MMVINGPAYTNARGAEEAIPFKYQSASEDEQAALGLKYAAWEHEFKQRQQILAILNNMAARRQQAKQANKSKGGWGGLAGGIGGAALGGVLAAPTGGMSVLAGAGLGAGLGATGGAAIDSAMGNNGSGGMQMGNTLMDFSTEFLPTNPNPYYQAGMGARGPSGGYGAGPYGLLPQQNTQGGSPYGL